MSVQDWAALRAQRNQLLKDTDWIFMPDVWVIDPNGGFKKNPWQIYRQALRDLPANTADPSAPVWPVPPVL